MKTSRKTHAAGLPPMKMIKFLILPFIAVAALISTNITPRLCTTTVQETMPLPAQTAHKTASSPASTTGATDTFMVAHVSDGDTLRLSNHEKVRLTGIDTPESADNAKLKRDAQRSGQDKEKIIVMGKKAAQFTASLVEGRRVRLEYDVRQRDKYERLLAYVFLQSCAGANCKIDAEQGHHYVTFEDGIYDFLNATLVKSGYAQAYTIPPNVKYRDLFRQLQREAREQKRGLWAGTSFNPTDEK